MFLPAQSTTMHRDIIRFAQTIAQTLQPAQGLNVIHMEDMMTALTEKYSQNEIQAGIQELSQTAFQLQFNAMLASSLSPTQQSILAVCMSMFFVLSMWEMTTAPENTADRWQHQVRHLITQIQSHLQMHHRRSILITFGVDPAGESYYVRGEDFDLNEWLVNEQFKGWL